MVVGVPSPTRPDAFRASAYPLRDITVPHAKNGTGVCVAAGGTSPEGQGD